MKLSIVIGTLNRLPYLQKCIESVRKSCGNMEHEIVVVDGNSQDGTQAWAASQQIVFIEQGAALGAVAAFNAGFYAADGDYVAALNDDCIVVGDTLPMACQYLDEHADVGQVALPWHDVGDTGIQVQYVTIGIQQLKVIYANFGVTRRWLGEKVGWWGKWEHYSGDCELSFNILMEGYKVDALPSGEVLHFRAQDSTRRVCWHNQAFLDKWWTIDVSKLMPV